MAVTGLGLMSKRHGRVTKKIGHATNGVPNTLGAQAAEDRTKQSGREQGAIAALKEAMALFDENYGKGAENRALTAASSSLINTGLGNTTRQGAVSAGLSAEFEDMRRGRMSTALSNFANFMGSYRDPTMVTPGLALQERGQEQQHQLGQGQLAVSAMGRGRGSGTSRQPTFAPGPISMAATPQSQTRTPSAFDSNTMFGNDSFGTPSYGGLGDFDPAAANARMGNTLQTPQASNESWFNWEDPLSFEGLNFG